MSESAFEIEILLSSSDGVAERCELEDYLLATLPEDVAQFQAIPGVGPLKLHMKDGERSIETVKEMLGRCSWLQPALRLRVFQDNALQRVDEVVMASPDAEVNPDA